MVAKRELVWIVASAIVVGWSAGVHGVYAGLNIWGSVAELALTLIAWAIVWAALVVIDHNAQRPKAEP